MEAEPFRETPKDESEHKLWVASQLYIHGEIGIDTFENIELPYTKDYKKMNGKLVNNTKLSFSSLLWQIIFICILIIFYLIFFSFTKNIWTLSSLFVLIYLFVKFCLLTTNA